MIDLNDAENLEIKPLKTLFGYYGGKTRNAKKIIKLIPRHMLYAEPFCGSAAILFMKPYPSVTRKGGYIEAINDTNDDLINFFKTLRDEVKGYELAKRLLLTPYSFKEYTLKLEQIKDEIERARVWFIKQKHSFANNFGGGWGYSLASFNGENQALSKCVYFDLEPYIRRLKFVHIDCVDALKFIRRWDTSHTFFFVDPPYPKTDQGFYKGYTVDDFANLCKTLDESKGSFILTCYPFDGILDMLPRNVEIFKIKSFVHAKGITRNSRNDRTHKEEWIIRRFSGEEPADEVKQELASDKYSCFIGEKFKAGPDGELIEL